MDLRWKVKHFDKFFIFLNILISDDLCILNELGWIDAEGEAIEEVMNADLKTLPADVYEKISEDKIDECADKLVTKMAKKHQR